jgi:8-oxo-dGTP pyrophosphatase MutT (NUDIX family)
MPNLLSRTSFFILVHLRAVMSPVSFAVQALVEQGGKVVLIRHSGEADWGLPGGGVGRGEPPEDAILRELREEIGLTHSATPQLVGLYTRKVFLVTNLIALYRVREAGFVFKPNFEVRELMLTDPAAPPPGTKQGVRRRLAELLGESPHDPYW